MSEKFPEQAKLIVGPVLQNLGFTLEEVDDAVDEGGRRGAVLYYRRPDCKIQIYWSAREHEINCMIGPLEAPNEHGLYNRSGKWHYLNDFTPTPQIPLEDLVHQLRSERSNFESHTKWLKWLAQRVEDYYEDAYSGILKLYG